MVYKEADLVAHWPMDTVMRVGIIIGRSSQITVVERVPSSSADLVAHWPTDTVMRGAGKAPVQDGSALVCPLIPLRYFQRPSARALSTALSARALPTALRTRRCTQATGQPGRRCPGGCTGASTARS